MLSPSDFNNAVPQFTNGNYASNPINPQYIAEPDAESYNRGTEPLQTLPAQWWNWFLNKFTARFNKVNIYVKNIFNELAQVLSIFNITPDGTEQTPTTSQLKTVFECCYPQYVKNDLYGNTVGTALGTAAVGTCTTFARSDHVHPLPSYVRDNYNATQNIYIGYSCTGLTCAQISHIAGYSSSIYEPGKIVIKDIAKNEMQNWLGLGTAAYCPASAFRASDWVPTQVEYSRMTSFLVESASCGTDGTGMYITADSGNELNMHPKHNGNLAWLNYRGGVSTVYIGDGNANSSGYGTAIAACFCGAFEGNLTGTASCATCASCADNACHAFLVSDGTAIGCAECNNEFNLYPALENAMWLNFRGGAAITCIGNGAGNNGLGDLYASTVHADVAGEHHGQEGLVCWSRSDNTHIWSVSTSSMDTIECDIYKALLCASNGDYRNITGNLNKIASIFGSFTVSSCTVDCFFEADYMCITNDGIYIMNCDRNLTERKWNQNTQDPRPFTIGGAFFNFY